MSIITSFGTSDTTIAGVTPPVITTPVLNYKTDFRVKSESSKEVIAVNTTTPLDQTETIRFGYSEIANIYANSNISSDFISGSKTGINLLVQLTDIVKVSDTTNTSFAQYLPLSAHLVIKVPQSGYVTTAMIQGLIARLNACLYENGTSLINPLTKGILKPASL